MSEQARAVAERICRRLHNHWPDDTSVPDVTAILDAYAAEIWEAAAKEVERLYFWEETIAPNIIACLREKVRSSTR